MAVFVIFYYRLAQAQEIKIEYMRVAAEAVYQSAVTPEEIAVPQREIAEVGENVIYSHGVIGDDELRLDYINEIELRIYFKHFPYIGHL